MAEARKTVTVVFADVAGSTGLGEALDPETLRGIMQRIFADARGAIERHGGTVEKFIGDAVMAVFGIPSVHEDDALRAVRAVWEMRERLAALNEEFERERGFALALRTGVNTGEVVAGDPSSGEFYATGDAVNVAARLQQAAHPGEILLGESTYRLVRNAVQVEAVEPLSLKGKTEPVVAHRLAGLLEGAPGVVRRFDSPWVGRTEELARLRQLFDRVAGERLPLLVTVLGPAGIGKTRLASELAAGLSGQAAVLHGHCLSYGEGITFWPLQEILRSLPERPGGIPDPEQARSTEETFWAYRKLFEGLAAEQPLVLVLEDIHWAEPTLLELLEHVVEWTRDAPILLLCLARPELLDDRPGWPGERLELEPLHDEEVDALMSALTEDLEEAERTRITEAAQGNPFFAEQMVALALEENGREADVPPTIQLLLAARLDRLAADERALLECAAVVGKEVWRGALLELSSPGTEVSAVLQRLVRKGLIRPERSSFPGEDAFLFAHLLVRDASYAAIPKGRRAELHERFAGWIEQSENPYGETAGYHLEQAYRYLTELGPVGDRERELASHAATKLTKAGLSALRHGDSAGAANLISRGLELLPEEAPDRGDLLLALGDSLDDIGDPREALTVSGGALAAAEAAADRGLAWEATLQGSWLEGRLAPGARSNEEYLNEAEQAAAELRELGHERGLARAWRSAAAFLLWSGNAAAAAKAAEQAAALAQRAGEWTLERDSLLWLGFSLCGGPAPAPEGIRRCEEILAGTSDLDVRSSMRQFLSSLHAMLGHADEARRLYELALADAQDLGLKPRIAATEFLDLALEATFTPAEAERCLQHSLALWQEMGEDGIASSAAARLARTLCAQGRFEEAERYLALAENAAAFDDYESQSLVRAARARMLAHTQRLDQAESLAREAVTIVDRTDNLGMRAWLRTDLAEVLELAGKTTEACSVLEAAVGLAEAKEEVVLAEPARARLAELQASAPHP
ncbi:MAG TPA: adenylate/guanylate cyclase domain-containing protein [Gaiellaceae bacterium]|jgi:class 3 adenylate cyclase/tetratricopeptide (TPR) repeat protein